ncbi:PKD domain-containing protein, partial [candidate division GN15 bacterium]|nr:PKD domain-containing protein [candidate division GN15 bacterium]
MRKSVINVLTGVLAAVLLLPCVVSAVDMLDVDPSKYVKKGSLIGYVPDRFIVVMKDNVPTDHAKAARQPVAMAEIQSIAELADRFDVTEMRPQFRGSDKIDAAKSRSGHRLSQYYKVTITKGSLEEAMAAFEADPLVDHVEPIGIHLLYATPNDPDYSPDQWHYFDTYGIEADQAWDVEAGSQSVLVGDLDIGTMYDHGDLGGSDPPGPTDNVTNGNIWINTGETVNNGVDDDGNGYVDDILGWDFVERTDWYSYSCVDIDCGGADNDPSDGDGHGTHTAGTIAAITNNGYAVAGVAGGYGNGSYSGGGNGVKIVPCRIGYVLDYWIYGPTGVVIMDYVAEAMYYMGDLKASGWNVAAINCSFGTSNSGGLSAAADYLISQDVVICVAAGNSSSSSPDYLGSRGDCVDVGATDVNGNPASFTNYGSWVDIAAPGVNILSTMTDPSNPGVDYVAALDGTSMACPHVAGAIAVMESLDPSLSAADKINILLDPANMKSYNQSRDLGDGLLDLRACLDAIGPADLPPVAEFTGSPTSGVYPLNVNFTDLSANSPTSWSWDFGDGGSSTAQNPSHTYTSAGTYTVSLTATNAYGSDSETKTNYITVTAPPPPTADFTGAPTSGDAPLAVNFTDLSSDGPTSWDWDFGDGGTSTAQNPSHTYNDVGTYTVSLTVSNAYGSDVETKTSYITVNEPGSGYASLPYSTGFESGALDQYWFTQSSNSEGRIQITTANSPRGAYHLTMDDNLNGGSYAQNEAWLSLAMNGASQVELSFWWKEFSDEDHTQDGVFFSDNGGASFVKVYDLVGGSTAYQNIVLDVDQLATSNGLTLSNTFVIKFQQYDNYGITTDGMAFDDVSVVSNDVAPVADFIGSPTSGDFPLDVTFTDQSSGNPTSWSWDFGDGGSSTAQNPSHTYTAAGTYTVTLTASNAFGFDDEVKTNYITVTTPPAPTAAFSGTPTSGTFPLEVSFTDESTDNPTSWSWDFGDGGTSAAQNPSHTYTAAGTYTVTLTASNAYGSDDEIKTDYITVTAPPPPTADFVGSPTSGPAPLAVTFTDQSTGSPTGWSWDFGDGGSSTAQNPSHTYNAAGTYTVTLTATNAYGSDDETKIDYITVTEPGTGYASLPYSTGFESGSLDEHWFTQSSNSEGRILVTSANAPRGAYHLTMDDNLNGGAYAQNEAWLSLDLAGKSDVDLSFWWKEFSDEDHSQDGVYFSDNGGDTFVKVYNLTGGSTSYQEIVLDVDALAAGNGLSLTGTFVVKFQQY